MGKLLFIPPPKPIKGLKIWCDTCHSCVKDTCKTTGKSLKNCPKSDRHKFKVIAHVPETKLTKTKVLETRNFEQAKKEAEEFIKSVHESISEILLKPNLLHLKNTGNTMPVLFQDTVIKYIAYLEDIDLPFHLRKHRGDKHLGDLKTSFFFLLECLENHHDLSTFSISDFLDENIVGEICSFLENAPFGATTYNRRIKYYKAFEKWLNRKLKYPLQNLFEEVTKKPISYKPQAISEEEFIRLLEQITPENGIKKVNYKSKKNEYHYRTWLKNGLRLALECGGRREEIISAKFSDIQEQDGQPSILTLEDFKMNRQHKLTGANKKYVPCPVSVGLKELLTELGYQTYKGTDRYLIAPEIIGKRNRMHDSLSRGFSHYYQQLNTGRNLTFYSCRRANITSENLHRPLNVKPTHHADTDVEKTHYIDPELTAKAKKGFEVFPKATD